MLEPRVAATHYKGRLQLPFHRIHPKRTLPSVQPELNNPAQKGLNASTKQKVYMPAASPMPV